MWGGGSYSGCLTSRGGNRLSNDDRLYAHRLKLFGAAGELGVSLQLLGSTAPGTTAGNPRPASSGLCQEALVALG